MSKRFAKDEKGSATIEFALWVPLFAVLLMLASDASFMFLTMTRMEDAARDAARRVSMGQLNTASVGTYVVSTLDAGPYSVSAACSTGDYACVRITRPVDSIVTFTVLEPLLGTSIGAETKMRLEPGVTL